MKKKFLGTVLISLLLAGVAFAAPTTQLMGGVTTVELSPQAIQAFTSQNIAVSAIAPATLDSQNGIAGFPIPGGAIDLGSSRGDIFHTGGLAFDSADTNVALLNFIISTTGQSPVLNGLVAVNDDVANRIPLFNLELTQALQVGELETIIIENVNLTLTQTAADALNNAFGTSAFQENFLFGSADVVAQSLDTSTTQDETGNASETMQEDTGTSSRTMQDDTGNAGRTRQNEAGSESQPE